MSVVRPRRCVRAKCSSASLEAVELALDLLDIGRAGLAQLGRASHPRARSSVWARRTPPILAAPLRSAWATSANSARSPLLAASRRRGMSRRGIAAERLHHLGDEIAAAEVRAAIRWSARAPPRPLAEEARMGRDRRHFAAAGAARAPRGARRAARAARRSWRAAAPRRAAWSGPRRSRPRGSAPRVSAAGVGGERQQAAASPPGWRRRWSFATASPLTPGMSRSSSATSKPPVSSAASAAPPSVASSTLMAGALEQRSCSVSRLAALSSATRSLRPRRPAPPPASAPRRDGQQAQEARWRAPASLTGSSITAASCVAARPATASLAWGGAMNRMVGRCAAVAKRCARLKPASGSLPPVDHARCGAAPLAAQHGERVVAVGIPLRLAVPRA